MTTTSIRVSRETQQRLKDIARREQKSIGAVLDEVITRYEREAFQQQMQEDFHRLRQDPGAWSEYREETALWDQTAADGLENEPRFFDDEPDQ
jgi:predicted transcriptional regulator